MKMQVWQKRNQSEEDLPPAPPSLSPSSEGLPPPPPIGESAEESAGVKKKNQSEEDLPPAPPSLSPTSEGLPPPPPIGESADESASEEEEEKAEEDMPPAPPSLSPTSEEPTAENLEDNSESEGDLIKKEDSSDQRQKMMIKKNKIFQNLKTQKKWTMHQKMRMNQRITK